MHLGSNLLAVGGHLREKSCGLPSLCPDRVFGACAGSSLVYRSTLRFANVVLFVALLLLLPRGGEGALRLFGIRIGGLRRAHLSRLKLLSKSADHLFHCLGVPNRAHPLTRHMWRLVV